MKKKFLMFVLTLCLIMPCLCVFSACSSSIKVTYDYNLEFDASAYFEHYTTQQELSQKDWIVNMPVVTEDFKGIFKGWYIKDTNKQVEDYDYIGGDITLVAKYDFDYGYSNCTSFIYDDENDGYECVIDAQKSFVSVPKYYNGNNGLKEVISVSSGAHLQGNELSRIILPSTVKYINDYTFEYCDKLKSVVLPNSLVSIGKQAFMYSGIESIVIPELVKTIDERCFKGSNLINLTLPKNIERIEDEAFAECYDLEVVYFNGSFNDWDMVKENINDATLLSPSIRIVCLDVAQ